MSLKGFWTRRVQRGYLATGPAKSPKINYFQSDVSSSFSSIRISVFFIQKFIFTISVTCLFVFWSFPCLPLILTSREQKAAVFPSSPLLASCWHPSLCRSVRQQRQPGLHGCSFPFVLLMLTGSLQPPAPAQAGTQWQGLAVSPAWQIYLVAEKIPQASSYIYKVNFKWCWNTDIQLLLKYIWMYFKYSTTQRPINP